MAISVPVGFEFFDDLIDSGAYFVDKTELIHDLVCQAKNKVTLFTRPRRFGKTLNMSMLECFFNITRDSKNLFSGLNIAKYQDICDRWMNQYPVLFITLKDVEGRDFNSAFGMLESVIAEACKRYSHLSDNEKLNESDRQTFLKLEAQTADENTVKLALKTLTRILSAAYGKPAILLIDEYDVPLDKAQINGYYSEMLDMIRSLLSNVLKTNDHLKFAVITGCLRIAKESIFTGVNNFVSYSVLNKEFSQYFGFTEDEVLTMLRAADRTKSADTIKEWYDGYLFGSRSVYCPWDVVNYVAALLYQETAKPKNYWKNTSGNGIIRLIFENTGFDVREKFEILLNGGTIEQHITGQLTYDRMYDTEENLWNVLLMTGYLTKANPEEEGDTVSLRLPNKEIAGIFEDTVVHHFSDTLDDSTQKALMNMLWNGDETGASKAISDLLWDTISFNDYHEDYYHVFLTGLFVGRGYAVESNKERGIGRPDILLKDHRNRRALIIEAKKSVSEAAMEQDCCSALRQIDEQEYADRLYGYRQVLRYGISFYRKTALVKLLK